MNGLDPALEGSVDFEKVVDPLSELMVDDFLLSVRSGRVEVVPEDTLLPLLLWLLLLPLAKYRLSMLWLLEIARTRSGTARAPL